MEPREFVIGVRRRWTLWILPVIALLYFAFILYIAFSGQRVRGIDTQLLVLIGVGLFALILLVQLPFMFTRRVGEAPEEPLPAEADPYAPPPFQEEPAPEPVPAAEGAPRDDELVLTSETQKGMRVLEYSRPAKSANRGSVYAKAYLPVTKEYVLRIETLAAEPHDL